MQTAGLSKQQCNQPATTPCLLAEIFRGPRGSLLKLFESTPSSPRDVGLVAVPQEIASSTDDVKDR